MKNLIIVILISVSIVEAQNYPVIGEEYAVKYNLSAKNIFQKNSVLTLVYVFDYWGTKPSRENLPEELFQNVIDPIPNRVNTKIMKMDGELYIANILVPDSVALLSYYITDGIKNDYNNNATYTEYICDKNGKPVKGAKFRKIEFMEMGSELIDDQIKILNEEIKEYPDYHVNRFVLWKKIFQKQKTIEELAAEKENAIKYFEELINNDKEEWELYDRYFNVLRVYQSSLYKFLQPEFEEINKKILDISAKVPKEKRTKSMQYFMDNEKRMKQSKELKANIIGKSAFDFDYTTINGKKGKLSDFRGKVVLLDFWGTWCAPCVGEIPNLLKAYKKFNEKGFEIISISSDGFNGRMSEEKFKEFTNTNKMIWTQILDSNDQKLHNLYKISHWPTLYLVDRDGKVIKNEEVLRGETLIQTLEEILK